MTSKKFHTGRVTFIAFSHFVHDMYTSFLPPLLPLIVEKLSITLSQAGLLSTVMQIPAVLNPLIGLYADTRGLARWMVILAPTLTAVPMSFMLNVSSYWLLLFLVFFAGISVALYHAPAPVLVANYAGGKKGRGMSFFMTGGESARTLGPMLAVGTVSLLGENRFYSVMVIAVLTSVLLFFLLEKEAVDKRVKKKGSLKEAFLEVRHVLIPLSGILLARSFMHSAMGIFLSLYVEQQTGSLLYGGAALALYEVFGVAGALSSGTLSDWAGRRRVLFWVLLAAPFSVLFFVVSSGPFKIAMLIVTGFTVLATTPVMLTIIQENARMNPSAANGLFMMISFAVRSVAVFLVGVIGDMTGLDSMYIASALIGFAALPFLFKLDRDS